MTNAERRAVIAIAEMQVLIAEDNQDMLEFCGRVVRSDGHYVVSCLDGGAALDFLAKQRFDLLILDLRLPVVSGFDICRRMRGSGDRTFVLALTGLTSDQAQIEALDAGADDFLTKPCSYDVLRARVRAIMRRTGALSASIRLGKWQLDRDSLTAFAPGSPGTPHCRFSPIEMRVLCALLERVGTVVPREELLTLCWDDRRPVSDNALSAVAVRLRQKLSGSGLTVTTHRNRGIALEYEESHR